VAASRSDRHRAFGAALRERRIRVGLSQEQLAEVAGLDRTYVSGVERGERNPSLTNIYKLSDALATTLPKLAARAERLRIKS